MLSVSFTMHKQTNSKGVWTFWWCLGVASNDYIEININIEVQINKYNSIKYYVEISYSFL